MGRILPLSAETISQIYSSKQITSLEDVVLALLENSLDAGSNKVEITVDFRRGGCTVEDNGSGIPPSEFLEDGGLGKMYHTSKHATSTKDELHGSTGAYLASLSALSLLNISTYHSNRDQQSTLTIHQGKVIARHVPALPAHELSRCAFQGTCVTIRDLFGNMPVRVKQRALAASEGNDNGKAWLGVKRGIVALLLAWPKPCAVRIRDADSENRVLHLSGVHPSINNALTKKSLKKLDGRATKFDLQDVLPILSQAGFASVESRSQWIPISASTPKISVKGAICRDPQPTKQCQFISVGIHPCSVASGNSDMYEVINRIFSNSSFGAVEHDLEVDELEKDRRKRDRRFKSDGYTQKQLHGRKGVDRWPMFVLQIKHVGSRERIMEPDHMSEPSLKGIVDVLEATITQWLAANHFRPRKFSRRKKEDIKSLEEPGRDARSDKREIMTPIMMQDGTVRSATTSKKRKYIDITGSTRVFQQDNPAGPNSPQDYFSSWSRIKSGKDTFYDELWQGQKPATAPAAQKGTRAAGPDVQSRSMLQLPALEAGEFSKAKPLERGKIVDRPVSEVLQADESSEDFGSFDDREILAAVGDLEQHTIHDAQPNLVSNDDIVVSTPQREIFQDAVMDWTDPVTKRNFQVNARTGVVLPSRPRSAVPGLATEADVEAMSRNVAAIDTFKSSSGNPLSLAKRIGPSKQSEHAWLPGFLKEWNNPVFVQQNEERIPVTSFNDNDIYATEATTGKCTHAFRLDGSATLGETVPSSLSKAALRSAKVIKQVDQKYILCKADTIGKAGNSEILVLIDQHAASERVILESLLADLCSPAATVADHSGPKAKSMRLEKSLHFQISETEYEMFHHHAEHFADWGILYKLFDKDETLGASQVRAPKRECTIVVQELPPAIAERCSLVPKLLIELLRSEGWSLEGTNKKPRTPRHPAPDHESNDGEHAWLKHLGSCPKGLLDMLNSRACRSAIMFNDELSIAQCQELLSDLSKCAFPFMCAHGRVSMVPLVEIGSEVAGAFGHSLLDRNGGADASFSEAFGRWITKGSEDIDAIMLHS